MRTDQDPGREAFPPVAREGFPHLAIGLATTVIFSFFWWPVGVMTGAATLFTLWFFRDPTRVPPADPDAVVAPADGAVLSVAAANDPDVGPGSVVVIFMNVFNVHINRVPMAGSVVRTEHHPGSFLSAFKPEAAEANERTDTLFDTRLGRIKCVQIAGLIARRIVCRAKPGQTYRTGERYGLIKFGSRVDVYLPASLKPLVSEGDRVKSGLTVLAGPR
jgi:phosphatidylserine decarboxylase